jgi:PAS domain S-box-containing protein
MDTLLVRNILESMGDCVLVVGAGGDIVYANSATRHVLGYSPDTLKKQGLGLTFFTRDENLEFNQIFVDAIKDKSVGRCGEVDYRHPDAGLRRLAVTTSYVVDTAKTSRPFVGFMAIFRDVTELFHLREREKRLLEERQRASARKVEGFRKLAAGVAHEIRNPATTVGGFASRLLKMRDVPHDAKSYLEKIKAGALRLESLVIQVQDYCNMGPAEFSYGRLAHTVGQIVAEMRNEADTRKVALHFTDETSDGGGARFDHGLIRKALRRIILNALDFSPKGSAVEIRLSDASEEATIEVRDQGCGISPRDIDYIFNPFFSTRADKPGMGLAVAQRIVHDHFGAITVESQPGKGATFRVTLPKYPAAQ